MENDGSLMTWISAKPTDWTPQVNYHISWKMAEKSVLCGKILCSSLSRFQRLVLHFLPHLCLWHRYRRTKFVCPATIRSVNKHGETRYRLNSHEEKKSHSLPERLKLRNAGGPELLGLYGRDAQVKPYLEHQNLGELITVEHKFLIETCESGNSHRCATVVRNFEA